MTEHICPEAFGNGRQAPSCDFRGEETGIKFINARLSRDSTGQQVIRCLKVENLKRGKGRKGI